MDVKERIVDYLIKLLEKYGIQARKIEFSNNQSGLMAKIGDGKGPVLGFAGHEGSEAVNDSSNWAQKLLGGKNVSQQIYGYGSTNMKTGLAAAIIAMIRLKEMDVSLHGTFRIYATVGEQTMVEQGLTDDLTALIIGEPSEISLTEIKSFAPRFEKLGIITETDLKEFLQVNQGSEQHFLEIAHKNALSYDIISHGKTVHSSMTELGTNAIDGLLSFIYEQNIYFEELIQKNNHLLGLTAPVLTKISGGEQVNAVPGEVKLSVFVRTIPEISNEQIINHLTKLIKEINAKINGDLSLKINFQHRSVGLRAENRLSRIMQVVGERYLQQKLGFISVPGGTDASKFSKKKQQLEVLIFGPENTAADQVDADAFHNFIKIYQNAVAKYLA
ncbi:M20/M25/M40 family metallo-hydrolase [Liquorilactobacillus nagelii]|uniref:M20/M25/M40 family metallo-hydrolase n=1 Tax=Liquorilactobacillus nagelii TaxID=82688 RepID=UPI001CC91DA3|nr:M20/M25/M40 family metallo-hydrolase [Liquorilactobacillus nagelii]ULQ48979.1 M20/M25/M40 family metallo-hydrolase [Liquorilactobacillus nagelii]